MVDRAAAETSGGAGKSGAIVSVNASYADPGRVRRRSISGLPLVTRGRRFAGSGSNSSTTQGTQPAIWSAALLQRSMTPGVADTRLITRPLLSILVGSSRGPPKESQ